MPRPRYRVDNIDSARQFAHLMFKLWMWINNLCNIPETGFNEAPSYTKKRHSNVKKWFISGDFLLYNGPHIQKLQFCVDNESRCQTNFIHNSSWKVWFSSVLYVLIQQHLCFWITLFYHQGKICQLFGAKFT